MDGTTRCPHCETRFKIGVTQLEAHQGMVRCGKCMQVFDARPDFIPDHPSPQLELVMSEAAYVTSEAEVALDVAGSEQQAETEFESSAEALITTSEAITVAPEQENALDFVTPRPPIHLAQTDASVAPLDNDDTLDESVRGEGSTEQVPVVARSRKWLWATTATVLTVILLGQVAYMFRADIAARQPSLKSSLQQYCALLDCKVELPTSNELMSIESSSLEADPTDSRHISLNALLRNRANYPLAYPELELTLNDKQDSPLARRIFKPADYLPTSEHEQAGLQANHELVLKLLLDTTELNPNGYRLAVFYPPKH
jgi:predicted Zn finger-like uncharacterized protein